MSYRAVLQISLILFILLLAVSHQMDRHITSPGYASPDTASSISKSYQGRDDDRLPIKLKLLYELDPEVRLQIMREEYEKTESEKKLNGFREYSDEPKWISIGPANGAGKMNAIAFHPTNPNIIYTGGDNGGVWKSTDGGLSWVPLTDSIPLLHILSLAVAPSSPNIIYAGLPDGIFLRSSDEGATWSFPDRLIGRDIIFSISIHPNNAHDVVVGANGGFRSTDGGETWTNVIPRSPYIHVYDIVRDPSSPQILYASTFDNYVLKSTDGGTSWVEKSIGLPVKQNYERMVLAISPSDPRVLYASTSEGTFGVRVPSHIYKTTDGGESWIDLPSVMNNPDERIRHFHCAFGVNQTSRNNAIVVSPTDSNTVIAGGILYIRSTDGGRTWREPAFRGDGMHVDVVDMQYQGSRLWIANDGGLWSSLNNGETTTEHNKTLVTRQYYTLAINSIDENLMLAGSQDNGTNRHIEAGHLWEEILGGDGFDCVIHPNNPSVAYATVQIGDIYRSRSINRFNPEWQEVTPKYLPDDVLTFRTLLRIDANNPSTLYTWSFYRIWRTTDEGASWKPLPTTTTSGPVWQSSDGVVDFAVAPSNSSVLMALAGRKIFRSTDAGETWEGAPLEPIFLRDLEIDPRNPDIIYSTGFPTALVYMTTDAGRTWVTRDTGILSRLATIMRIDPSDSNILYCGTVSGVYRSTNQGANWEKFGTGLPNTLVNDMRILDDGSIVRVGTFGRGVWEIQTHPPSPPEITGASVSGKKLLITGNFFDDGAVLLLNGQKQKTQNDPERIRTKLISKKAGKKIQLGDHLQVRNPDGSLSDIFTFSLSNQR